MMLGTSPGVTDASAMWARSGGARTPSQSGVPQSARGFHVLSSSPSETGSFGGTPGSSLTHSGSGRNRRSLGGAGRASPSPVLSPTVTGFELSQSTQSTAQALGGGSVGRVSTKVSALRFSQGVSATSDTGRASVATAAVASDASASNAVASATKVNEPPTSPGGLSRGLSELRQALDRSLASPTHDSKPPRVPSVSSPSGSDVSTTLVDDTVEYYAGARRLTPLPALSSAEQSLFESAAVKHPDVFAAQETHDAFHLAATSLRQVDDLSVLYRSLTTASTLADLGMRAGVIAASLLHAALDANAVDDGEASARCGAEVFGLARDAARLSRVSELARASATEAPFSEDDKQKFRAMLIAMTDARVVVMKLAQRVVELEDDEFFGGLNEDAQAQLTGETLATYVPLASRLGTWSLKARLEDARFARVSPDTYADLKNELEQDGRRASVAVAVGDIASALAQANVQTQKVYGRGKSVFGVYRKMSGDKGAGRVLRDVHDVRAVRVIVETEEQCYAALDAVLATNGYTEVDGRTKDYVSHAKRNGYRSLHCVVVDANGLACEVQIRTPEMHNAAEYGIASHWRYKESVAGDGDEVSIAAAIDEQVRWARFALSWQGRLSYDARKEKRASSFVTDTAGDDDDGADTLCRVVPCPCPFPTHAPSCANHEDNLSFGAGGAHCLDSGFDSNLVSADSAGFSEQRASSGSLLHMHRTAVTFPVTIVAVVDGRMRVLDVPNGSRLSDLDLLSLGDPNDQRASDFFKLKSIVVNRESVPRGAEVAVTLRTGDLIEVMREVLTGTDGSPGSSPLSNVAALGVAAAEEHRRRELFSPGETFPVRLGVGKNNVISRNGFAP